ncbi:unnamed protein product, partial [Discosporangium mesarthrocarpum]
KEREVSQSVYFSRGAGCSFTLSITTPRPKMEFCGSGVMSDVVSEELEMLEAIFDGDITIENDNVRVSCHPRTAGDQSKRFVQAQVNLSLRRGYPAKPPTFSVGMTSCLGDEDVRTLKAAADRALALVYDGDGVACETGCLFLVLDSVIDALDQLNISGQCAICLEPLFGESGGEELNPVRTSCFHTFHYRCLACWWEHVRAARQEAGKGSVAASQLLLRMRALEAELEAKKELALSQERALQLISEQMHAMSLDLGTPPEAHSQLRQEKESRKRELIQAKRLVHSCYGKLREAEDQACKVGEDTGASLACPVCRKEVLLEDVAGDFYSLGSESVLLGPHGEGAHSAIDGEGSSAGVESLPTDLQEHVRVLQGQHLATLKYQAQRGGLILSEDLPEDLRRLAAESSTVTAAASAAAPPTAAPAAAPAAAPPMDSSGGADTDGAISGAEERDGGSQGSEKKSKGKAKVQRKRGRARVAEELFRRPSV